MTFILRQLFFDINHNVLVIKLEKQLNKILYFQYISLPIYLHKSNKFNPLLLEYTKLFYYIILLKKEFSKISSVFYISI